MQCPNCGAQIGFHIRYCGECGAEVNPPSNGERTRQGDRIGYSPRIRDRAYAAYRRKSATWAFLFAGILAMVAMIGFPIYAAYTGELEWPGSLYYGMGIGGMFLLIALIQTLKAVLDRTWDGAVAFKGVRKVRIFGRRGPTRYAMIYRMEVNKDSGGMKRHTWRNVPGFYDYYAVGDQVRHHKGFHYYEKHDKSDDDRILCPACLAFPSINNDVCPRCKCPLLK